MNSVKTLHDLDLNGKKVFVRADLNVPLNEAQEITDAHRVRSFLPTLRLILEKGGIPVIASHLGRPGGKRDEAFSLRPVAAFLREEVIPGNAKQVTLAPDCIGAETEKIIQEATYGDIVLLENLRWHSGETDNDESFAADLSRHMEVYVNDAFGTAHRGHASVVGVPKQITERAPGLLMQRELDSFQKAFVEPERPLAVVIGGAKISSKLGVLLSLCEKADKIIIGGAMANTFLAAQGFQMGRSLYEPQLFQTAIEIIGKIARRGAQLYLPVDVVVAPSLKSQGLARNTTVQEVPADCMALDIGPASRILFQEALQNAATIVWNGPMGAFESEEFAEGTESMVESIGNAHGLTVVGGGDTDAAIHKLELAHKFDYISTGGGAFLALFEGKTLPALEALGIHL
ncbi:phosphoglycerate kinase [bacterium]|nr:phosphoglycerate kinase [bacterium]